MTFNNDASVQALYEIPEHNIQDDKEDRDLQLSYQVTMGKKGFGITTNQKLNVPKKSHFKKRDLSPSYVRNLMIKNLHNKCVPLVVYQDDENQTFRRPPIHLNE